MREVVFNLEFEVDNVIPTSLRGSDEAENHALVCRSCNVRTGSADHARDPTQKCLFPIFNLGIDIRNEHFRLNLETFEFEGLTPTGRATARRLGMNRRPATQARVLWISRLLLW